MEKKRFEGVTEICWMRTLMTWAIMAAWVMVAPGCGYGSVGSCETDLDCLQGWHCVVGMNVCAPGPSDDHGGGDGSSDQEDSGHPDHGEDAAPDADGDADNDTDIDGDTDTDVDTDTDIDTDIDTDTDTDTDIDADADADADADDGGPTYSGAGAPCTPGNQATDCPDMNPSIVSCVSTKNFSAGGGSFSVDFSGGYCSLSQCTTDQQCGTNAACFRVRYYNFLNAGSICLKTCASVCDCRWSEGYNCAAPEVVWSLPANFSIQPTGTTACVDTGVITTHPECTPDAGPDAAGDV